MSCYPASASPGQIFSLFLCCSGGNDGMRLKMMSAASIDCRLHCFHKYLFWIKSHTEGSRSSTHGLVVFQKRTWTVTPARTNLNTGFYTSYQARTSSAQKTFTVTVASVTDNYSWWCYCASTASWLFGRIPCRGLWQGSALVLQTALRDFKGREIQITVFPFPELLLFLWDRRPKD